MKSKALTHFTAHRFVAPEALNVAPALVGSPLALPMRRALAMGLDLLVVALLSGVSGFWLLGGLAAVVLQLRSQRGGTLTRKRLWVGWGLAALLGLLALNEARDQWNERSNPVAAAAAAKESAREAAEEAAAALREASVEVSAQARDPDTTAAEAAAARKALEAAQAAASAVNAMAAKLGATGTVKVSDGSAASTAAAPLSAASAAEAAVLAAAEAAHVAKNRIADLESQLAEAKKPKPFNPRAEMKRLIAGIGLQFGWGMVYFSLLPAWWGGQTVGKKVFGLRVVEITGKPMTVMRCLKRYGGYAAGMATGGLGFGQMLWDPNRQGIQDKAAHTVVLDLRAAAIQASPVSPAALNAAPVPVETPPPPTAPTA